MGFQCTNRITLFLLYISSRSFSMCRRFLCLVSYVCVNVRVYIYRCRTSNVAITKIYTSSYSEILHCVTIIFSLILIIFIENSEKKCILCAWLYFAVMSYPFCNYNWWFCVSACVWLCPDVLSELCVWLLSGCISEHSFGHTNAYFSSLWIQFIGKKT